MLGIGMIYDNLDDRYFPTARLRLELRGERSLEGLGVTHAYWRTQAVGLGAFPIGRRTVVQIDGMLGLSGEDLPVYDRFRIGGPTLLPGYRSDERWGAQAAAAAVSVRRRLLGLVHGVARAGAGDVWATRDEMGLEGLRYGFSLGLLYPTRLGPAALDVGVRKSGDVLLTVSVGYP
jgi:NTE family protein